MPRSAALPDLSPDDLLNCFGVACGDDHDGFDSGEDVFASLGDALEVAPAPATPYPHEFDGGRHAVPASEGSGRTAKQKAVKATKKAPSPPE